MRVSLDETCVCLIHTGAKGTVMRCWPGSSAQVEAIARASRHQLRSSFTHVAMICDDASVQPLLPQLLVANEATMSRADAAFLRTAVPGNVYLVRQKKAWMTTDLMVWLVKLLGQCVKHYQAKVNTQPKKDKVKVRLIFSFDLHVPDVKAVREVLV